MLLYWSLFHRNPCIPMLPLIERAAPRRTAPHRTAPVFFSVPHEFTFRAYNCMCDSRFFFFSSNRWHIVFLLFLVLLFPPQNEGHTRRLHARTRAFHVQEDADADAFVSLSRLIPSLRRTRCGASSPTVGIGAFMCALVMYLVSLCLMYALALHYRAHTHAPYTTHSSIDIVSVFDARAFPPACVPRTHTFLSLYVFPRRCIVCIVISHV